MAGLKAKRYGTSLVILILGAILGFTLGATVAAHKYPGPELQGFLIISALLAAFFVIGHFCGSAGRLAQLVVSILEGLVLAAMLFPK